MTDITNTFSVKARKIKQKMNQITYENKDSWESSCIERAEVAEECDFLYDFDKITKLFQSGF